VTIAQDLREMPIAEIIIEMETLKKPSYIIVDHSEEFPRITGTQYAESEPLDTQALLEDEIPF
jgi:hypothetical protein